ncbi:MAG: hypothetical protein V4622_09855 [Bacteroidota bacterium]
METKPHKTHVYEVDFRISSLNYIISGFDETIQVLHDKVKEGGWYDGLWFLEETEPIYGLAFIAYQNYINASIKDLAETSGKKEKYYRIQEPIEGYKKTVIELIICLANYTKHIDDDGDFHKGTKETLEHFSLKSNKEFDVEHSAIFRGLDILNEKWDLHQITKIVTDWREMLMQIILKK